MLCYVMLCYVISYYILFYYITLYYIILHYIIPKGEPSAAALQRDALRQADDAQTARPHLQL